MRKNEAKEMMDDLLLSARICRLQETIDDLTDQISQLSAKAIRLTNERDEARRTAKIMLRAYRTENMPPDGIEKMTDAWTTDMREKKE